MFQNIEDEYRKNERKVKKVSSIFQNVFSLKYIPIYILTIMISIVGIEGEVSPFSISILAAALGNSIPILGIAVAGIIGNLIGFGLEGGLNYLLMAFIFIISTFLWRPLYNIEEKNEKIKLAKNLFISTFIVQIAKVGIVGFTIYDILLAISFSIVSIVFYKIFVNSLVVIESFREKRAFSIEEVLGASLLVAIAVTCFGDFNIFGFSIRNILSILIVLILGWQNGVLVGTTAGVTIGVTLGVITSSNPIMVAAYAISGMLAGFLNRFGKVGVIVGFCLGNVVLAYVSNGYTVEIIYFKEILIASIGLLAVPKSIGINIEEFIGNTNLLPTFPDNALNRTKETAEKLNNVSDTINEMAKTFEKPEISQIEAKKTNKEIFINELLDNLRGYESNMLYDDLKDTNGKIVNDIFEYLIDKQQVDRKAILKIFANCNSYIIGFEDQEVSKFLEDNIGQMVRVINMSYKISKSNFVWQKKMEASRKNIKTQLNGVSKAISNMAEEIKEDAEKEGEYKDKKIQIIEILKQRNIEIKEIYIKKEDRFIVDIYLSEIKEKNISVIEKTLTDVLGEKVVLNKENSIEEKISFISEDKYIMAIGKNEAVKDKSEISGDNKIELKLKDGKYLVAISDGMGSGKEANESSKKALTMLKSLLEAGFKKEESLELINSSLLNQEKEIYSTLDILIVDLYKGKLEFIKNGACPTYIKNGKKVQIIKASSLPAGIVEDSKLQVYDKDISNGDILLMCSDGILDSNVEYKNKELWLKYLLEDIETQNTKKIADIVLNESIDNNYGIAKDDMTVIVCKFLDK